MVHAVNRRDGRGCGRRTDRACPVAGIHVSLTRSTIAAGGPVAKPVEEDVEPVARALGDAADRAVHRVRDPAVEPEVGRLAQDEIAEADALDAAR